MGTLSNNTKVGDKNKDLVLKTSGRVYVQVKDRFYELNFRDDEIGDDKEEEKKEELPQIIIASDEDSVKSMEYPGDNHIIITEDGKFFISKDQDYEELQIQTANSTEFLEPITIDTYEAPLIISSNQLVKKLNAEYLNGIKSDKFARIDIPQTIKSNWTFDSIIIKKITDPLNRSVIDLENGVLSIDTINAKTLNIGLEADNPNLDNSNSTFDIINKPTYFSGGVRIQSSEIVDKVNLFFKNNGIWDSYNENAEVGGYSIYELITEAYNSEYIDNNISLEDYLNLLTTAYVLDDAGNWIIHTITSDDFDYIDDVLPIDNMKFIPKDRAEFEKISYQTNTCAEKIYDRWFDISTYVDDIKSKYTGVTYECNIGLNLLPAGTILKGNSSDGILEGLVVGGTETTIRIITSGTDCSMLYLDYDDVEEAEGQIEQCETSLQESIGKTISAPITVGNVLFTGSANNIIGNIEGIKNSVFGTLKGFGLTSEGNCYLVNPGIALVNSDNLNYLKLVNKGISFIGLNKNGENFITIQDYGDCDMRRNKMYHINNHYSYCTFGPMRVEDDGSATIGSGSTQITISTDGTVTIPSTAIV